MMSKAWRGRPGEDTVRTGALYKAGRDTTLSFCQQAANTDTQYGKAADAISMADVKCYISKLMVRPSQRNHDKVDITSSSTFAMRGSKLTMNGDGRMLCPSEKPIVSMGCKGS